MTCGPLPMSKRAAARPECSRRDDSIDLYGFYTRQREGDNYRNGLTKPPWARWWHEASGQRHRVIVVVVECYCFLIKIIVGGPDPATPIFPS